MIEKETGAEGSSLQAGDFLRGSYGDPGHTARSLDSGSEVKRCEQVPELSVTNNLRPELGD